MNRMIRGAIFLTAVALPGWLGAVYAQDPYRLKPGARGELCLECHVTFQESLDLPFVHTPVAAGNCADCHNPHASTHGKLLAGDPGTICARCHEDQVPETARSAHDPVVAGNCIQCHDPHAAPNASNLKFAGNQLCDQCHQEIAAHAARSRFQHDPVDKGCIGCHDPHASSRSGFLLKKEVPALCKDCHRTDQAVFRQQHMDYPVEESRCTSCHDPHGSDNGGLLWASVHTPLVNKMCNQCHMDSSSPDALDIKRPGFELCRGCHSGLVNEIFSRNRIHWPAVDGIGCLNCHRPHASKEVALLRDEPKSLCGTCHTDTLDQMAHAEVKHSPVAEGECSACHSPHASNQVFLFQEDNVMNLCGNCHDWQTHSTHPIGEMVVDQRNQNLTLDCRSCHRAHGSPFKSISHFDTDAELCVQCHLEFKR